MNSSEMNQSFAVHIDEEGVLKNDPFMFRSNLQVHEIATGRRLQEILLQGLPFLKLDAKGIPEDKLWLNKFSHLTCHYTHAPNGLKKGKIESRAYQFGFDGSVVTFAIDRHPVGRLIRQRWSFDIKYGQWNYLGEELLRSAYEWTERGQYFKCPTCGDPLDLTAGKAKCSNFICEFEDLHEHSLGM